MAKSFLVFWCLLTFGASVKAADYDVYPPASTAASTPVVIFVHGGAWVSGSRAQYRALGEALSGQGICAVVVSYPMAPAAKHPAPVDALERSIKDFLSEKQQLRCDRDRVFLMGHSAGAHMIAMWNATYENPAIKGFIGLEGIYDIENLLRVWPGYKDWFVTKAFGADEKKYAAASPRQLKMKNKSPWLVVQSEKDELVDMAQSVDFAAALEKQGVKAELLKLKSGSHFQVVEDIQMPSTEVAKKISAFVRR